MRVGRARSLRSATAMLLGGAIVLLAGCRQSDGASAPAVRSTLLRIGLSQALSGAAGLTALAQLLTVESLARLADDGRPQPWLARDWHLSDDRRSLTVNLLSQTKFHDGTPLTADIVATALKSTLPTFMGRAFEDVESVTAASAEQVVIRLRRASPFLLDTLETSISKPGSPLVGTGPFVVTDPKSPTELRANADYALGHPGIDRISVETFPSVRAAWAEMLRERLDMLWEVGPEALDSLQASSNIATFTYTRRFQYLMILNTRSEALRSAVIRQALNMAVDRDEIVRDALGGHGVASSGPVWPRNYLLRGDDVAPKHDAAAAAQALARAVPNRPAALRFTCLVLPDAVHERIALTLKRQLASVGIHMTVEQADMATVAEAVKSRHFEAILTEMISGPSILRLYRLWHSGGANGASSASMDAALDRVRHAASDDEYRNGVTALQQAVVDDPPAIFLAWMERARAVSKRFVVPAAEPGRDVLSTLRLWKPTGPPQQAARN